MNNLNYFGVEVVKDLIPEKKPFSVWRFLRFWLVIGLIYAIVIALTLLLVYALMILFGLV